VTLNDAALMQLHLDILFTYDDRGRMLQSNEPHPPSRRPAPRLYRGRALERSWVRFGATLPNAVVRRLQAIIDREPPSGDLAAPPSALPALRAVLTEHAPIEAETAGPVYRFPDPIQGTSEAIQLTSENVASATETFPWLTRELADWWPCFAIVRDGAVVSVCFSSRIGTMAVDAGLETLPAFRGRGYAVAVTAAWGAAVRASGRVPLYSTGWDNHASRAVAARVGLPLIGTDASWA